MSSFGIPRNWGVRATAPIGVTEEIRSQPDTGGSWRNAFRRWSNPAPVQQGPSMLDQVREMAAREMADRARQEQQRAWIEQEQRRRMAAQQQAQAAEEANRQSTLDSLIDKFKPDKPSEFYRSAAANRPDIPLDRVDEEASRAEAITNLRNFGRTVSGMTPEARQSLEGVATTLSRNGITSDVFQRISSAAQADPSGASVYQQFDPETVSRFNQAVSQLSGANLPTVPPYHEVDPRGLRELGRAFGPQGVAQQQAAAFAGARSAEDIERVGQYRGAQFGEAMQRVPSYAKDATIEALRIAAKYPSGIAENPDIPITRGGLDSAGIAELAGGLILQGENPRMVSKVIDRIVVGNVGERGAIAGLSAPVAALLGPTLNYPREQLEPVTEPIGRFAGEHAPEAALVGGFLTGNPAAAMGVAGLLREVPEETRKKIGETVAPHILDPVNAAFMLIPGMAPSKIQRAMYEMRIGAIEDLGDGITLTRVAQNKFVFTTPNAARYSSVTAKSPDAAAPLFLTFFHCKI